MITLAVMNRIVVVLMMIAHNGGCQTQKPWRLPNGEMGYAKKCNPDMLGCYKYADTMCPGGYNIMEQDKPAAPSNGLNITTNVNIANSVPQRSGVVMMYFSCKQGTGTEVK